MEHAIWHHLTQLDIPAAEKIIRPILVYAFLVVGLRLAGKRELAQLNSMDLVVLLMLSNTVQNAIIGNDNSVTGGVIGAATLLLVNHLFIRFLFRHAGISRLVQGDPVPLVQKGQVLDRPLRHELITLDELTSAAHRQGFGGLEEVDRAVLEPSGTLSFFGKQAHPDIARQQQLLMRFDRIECELGELRKALAGRRESSAAGPACCSPPASLPGAAYLAPTSCFFFSATISSWMLAGTRRYLENSMVKVPCPCVMLRKSVE